MRRCILGYWLLIGLLGLGILATWGTTRLLDPISRDLESAAALALAGDWEAAEPLTKQARADWDAQWTLTAALSNHMPMENADNWFARLEVYAASKDPVRFAEACAQIAGLIRAIAEGQIPTLRNLL